jgi:hypothetical protein
VGLGPFHQYRFTFVSLKWSGKWLGFRAGFTIGSAERMFASGSPKDREDVFCDLSRQCGQRTTWRLYNYDSRADATGTN